MQCTSRSCHSSIPDNQPHIMTAMVAQSRISRTTPMTALAEVPEQNSGNEAAVTTMYTKEFD